MKIKRSESHVTTEARRSHQRSFDPHLFKRQHKLLYRNVETDLIRATISSLEANDCDLKRRLLSRLALEDNEASMCASFEAYFKASSI